MMAVVGSPTPTGNGRIVHPATPRNTPHIFTTLTVAIALPPSLTIPAHHKL